MMKPIAQKKEWHQTSHSLNRWIIAFFQYAINKKKSFYWAWDKFMIVIRRRSNDDVRMIIEIPLKNPPFLVQKQIDITNLSKDALLNTLVFILKNYSSSYQATRNKQSSVKFLSFSSFLHLVFNNKIKIQKPVSKSKLNAELLFYIIKTLNNHHIYILDKSQKKQQQQQQQQIASLSSLVALI